MIRTSVRTSGLIAVSLGAALLLGGCASSGQQDTAENATALLPAAEGNTEYPLTLESPYGETVLNERPERIAIVTASTLDTDALIAIGGTPILAPTTIERNAWLTDDDISSIEVLWESEAGAEAAAETVAAAKPDLIVNLHAYESFDQAQFDKMKSIAPVLYAEAEELTWPELTHTLGEALDLSDAATDAVKSAESAVTQLREDHPEFAGKTATQVMVYPQEYGAAYNTAPGFQAATIFTDLGFTLPAAAEQFVENDVISDELIGLVDADFVLVSSGTPDPKDSEYFTKSPLLTALPAYTDGRLIVDPADPETGINSLSWGINVPSALSVPWVSERVAELGAEALGS